MPPPPNVGSEGPRHQPPPSWPADLSLSYLLSPPPSFGIQLFGAVPLQPWIYAQSPRLRLTDSACPDVSQPTYNECYSEQRAGAPNANNQDGGGSVKAMKICSIGKQTSVGGEHDLIYFQFLLPTVPPDRSTHIQQTIMHNNASKTTTHNNHTQYIQCTYTASGHTLPRCCSAPSPRASATGASSRCCNWTDDEQEM